MTDRASTELGPAGLAFTERERRALRYCVYCPRMCRFACPVAHGESRESVTPWGLMRLLHLVDQGHVAADAPVLEVLNHCVSCGRCQSFCRHDNPVAEVLAHGRAQLVDGGLAVPASFEGPEGGCTAEVQRPVRHAEREDLPLFLPACAHLGAPEDAARLERGLDALEALGLPVATPADGAFDGCGFHEWEVGRPEAASESWHRFEAPAVGRSTPITDCAPSLWAVQDAAPGATGSVDHLVEWLHEHLEALPEGDGRWRVAVHDACFESRRLGLGDAVRAVVRRLTGAEPLDLHESRDEARCCGAAGRWASSFPEAAARAAETVAADVADAHVDLLVTPSPHCRRSLVGAAAGLVGPAGAPLEVVDLLGLLARVAELRDE